MNETALETRKLVWPVDKDGAGLESRIADESAGLRSNEARLRFTFSLPIVNDYRRYWRSLPRDSAVLHD